jgi:hypothetical protein
MYGAFTYFLVMSVSTEHIQDDSKSYGQTEFRDNHILQAVFSQQIIKMSNENTGCSRWYL